MKLYFVRHTSAADFAANDAQRTLTRRGQDEARRVGVMLTGMKARPSRIFSSPLLRAQQTAGIIASELQFASTTETLVELANGATTPDLLSALPVTGDEIALVGHMPSLADHVAIILGTRESDRLTFGRGSVACVEVNLPDLGQAKLLWLKHLSGY